MSGAGEGVLYFPEGGTYKQFIEHHLLKNEPCMFGEWVTKSWGSRTHWVREDGSPNFTYLAREFGMHLHLSKYDSTSFSFPSGNVQVSVANCTQCKFSTHPKTEMALKEYLEYWQSHASAHPACDDNIATTSLTQQRCDEKLYLKDWHFVK